MIKQVVILILVALLTLGQGRDVLRSIRIREAGWGSFKFAQSVNPRGFLAMAALDSLFFAIFFVWLVLSVRQLLP